MGNRVIFFFPHFILIIDNFMKAFILYYETKQVYVIRLLRKAPEI